MKKSSRHDQHDENLRRNQGNAGKKGTWAFNLASENLFALGATEKARRVAYRTATGEVRFLPL